MYMYVYMYMYVACVQNFPIFLFDNFWNENFQEYGRLFNASITVLPITNEFVDLLIMRVIRVNNINHLTPTDFEVTEEQME